jgi:RND family efflux transporter MFP subunit
MNRCLLPLLLIGLASPALAEDTTLDCLANPAQKVAVSSTVPGIIRQAKVGRGDRVSKGEILATLDSTVEEADVAVAAAQAQGTEVLDADQVKLTFAQANYDRAKALVDSGSVTQSKVEELQAAVAVARSDLATESRRLQLAAIELERAKAVLSLRTLRSPIDGFVISQDTQAGEYLQQDGTIFTIVQTDPLYVEAYAPVELYGRIKPGTTGTVVLDQPAGTKVEAKVTVVDPVFDAASSTFGLRLELPNPDSSIPAGQHCQLTLPLS